MKKLLILVGFCLGICLSGCTKSQADKTVKVENEVKQGIQIAEGALESFNSVIQVAAPNSKLAKDTAKATVTSQKVNGVVQSVTITIPVTDIPATTPPPNITPAQ